MQTIPKLTSARLAELPAGTPIRIGAQCVVFDHCAIETDYQGRDETFVWYVDADGAKRRLSEWQVRQSATEFTDAVLCAHCGYFRPAALTCSRPIKSLSGTQQRTFCSDTDCAVKSQKLNYHPRRKFAAYNRRGAR